MLFDLSRIIFNIGSNKLGKIISDCVAYIIRTYYHHYFALTDCANNVHAKNLPQDKKIMAITLWKVATVFILYNIKIRYR